GIGVRTAHGRSASSRDEARSGSGRMMGRNALKALARGVAAVIVVPSVMSFWIRSRLVGEDRALEGSTQAWALVPGIVGQYLRRAFLMRAIAYCHRSATIEFGTIFSAVK